MRLAWLAIAAPLASFLAMSSCGGSAGCDSCGYPVQYDYDAGDADDASSFGDVNFAAETAPSDASVPDADAASGDALALDSSKEAGDAAIE